MPVVSVPVPTGVIIRTVEAPGVIRGDASTPIVGDLVQRVLIALCSSFPRPLDAEQLATAVWVGERPISWKSSLRTHVSRLREALSGDDVPDILHTAGGYHLSSIDTIDLTCIDRWISSAGESEAEQQLQVAECILSFGPVDAIAASQPFHHRLLDAWVERSRKQQESAFHLKCRALVRLERFDEVLAEWLIPARQHLVDAELLEGVVDALLAVDRTDEANDILTLARIRLAEQGKGLSQPLQQRQRALVRTQLSEPAARVPLSLPLFGGREEELSALRAAIGRDDSIVLLSGEGGMGKSALVSRFVAEHEAQGGVVALVACAEHSAPGQAFTDLLASAAPNMIRPDLDQVEVMTLFVESMSRRQPLIVIDDLQLIDLASSKSLRRLLRRLRGTAATVLLSFRSGAHSRFVNEVIVDGLSSPGRVQLSLEPLTREEIFGILRQVTPGDVRTSQVWEQSGQVLLLTGGVPLLIDLILNVARLGGFPSDLGDPQRDETMLARMKPLVVAAESALTIKQAETLAIGAVYGFEFDSTVIAQLSGVSAADAFDAIDAAHRVGILERRSGNRVRFKHDLIRRVLLSSRPATWQCAMHRAIAEVMTARGFDLARVCVHRASALLDSTSEDAVIEVLDMVDVLKEQAQWDACTKALEFCRENLEAQPWLHSKQTTMRIFELLGHSYESTHDSLRAREAFRRAIEFAVGTDVDVARIAIAAAGSSQPIGGDDDRAAWLASVMYSEKVPYLLRLEVLAEYVYLQSLLAISGDVEVADTELQRMAAEIGTDQARAIALHGHLVTMLPYPNAQERIDVCAPLISDAVSGTRPDSPATLCMVTMGSLMSLGQFGQALEFGKTLETLASSLQRPADRWHLAVNQALVLEWTGRFDEATVVAEEALVLALRHEVHDGWLTFGSMHLGRALRDRSWDAFIATMLTSAVLDEEEEVTVGGNVIALRLGLADDRELFSDAVRSLREDPRHLAWLGTVILAADANVALGLPFAQELSDLLLPFSNTIAVNGLIPASTFGPVDRYLADLARQMGNEEEARHFTTQANDLAERAGLIGWTTV